MRLFLKVVAFAVVVSTVFAGQDVVKTSSGSLEGAGRQPSGVRAFKGVPFAQPPVGDLRWVAPRPVAKWRGVREAKKFGPRCMQEAVFGDMGFRSNGMSEDCLYLNIWTPARSGGEKLPVLVYYFGGGFVAGDGSEPRYDGESMAAKGIVSVTVNYRLGVFGFMAHPELTKESAHQVSGNYTLLDHVAALAWVHQNIAVFGGDPKRITIAGESAGSTAVSALMASPLSKDMIAGVIGESGSILETLPPAPLAQGEKAGEMFVSSLGKTSLADLRAIPAAELLEAAGKRGAPRFGAVLDGYFFPEAPAAIFAAGKQARVPLMAGWNSGENPASRVLGRDEATPGNLQKAITRLYGEHADEVAKEYASTTNDQALDAAAELASARFIAYSTWKWAQLAGKTGGKPVYRYYYSRPRPAMNPQMGNVTAGLAGGIVQTTGPAPAAPPSGAVHSAEIEYALGNLATNKVFAWTPDDYEVSATIEQYFANFIKTGNPNGNGLPRWTATNAADGPQSMQIDVETRTRPSGYEGRYQVLDRLAGQ